MISILEFIDVTVCSGTPHGTGLKGVNLSVGKGEIVLVKLEECREHNPLSPLAQGLLTPDSGKVRFRGEDWSQLSPSRISALRGRIRRVCDHYGWVANLDIMENLCISELHHTRRSAAEIEHEAIELARQFGIDPVPDVRPGHGHSATLRKLEWVRAFMGSPDLILLECPCKGAPKADGQKLLDAVTKAADHGVAVLWLDMDPHVINCMELARASKYRMDEETIKAV